jgi:hypothetical protein
MDRSRTLIATGALALALVSPAAAQAATDRNHDRIPDRWEREHHLSLRVDQSQRDQDHDGLRNRAEYRSHTDPRRRDSDRDGVPDAREDADHDGVSNASEQEHSGSPGAGTGDAPDRATAGGGEHPGPGAEHPEPAATVLAFAGGVLKIHQPGGEDAVATVDGATRLLCAPPVEQSVAIACPPERLVAGTRVLTARRTDGHWDFIVIRADPGAGTGPGTTPPPPPAPAAPLPAPASTGVITAVGDGSITITRPNGEVVAGRVRPSLALRCVRVAAGHVVSAEPCVPSNLTAGTAVALARRSLVDGGWTWGAITLIQPAA